MASRLLAGQLRKRIFIAGTSLGGAGIVGNEVRRRTNGNTVTPAEAQFHTSSMHPAPSGWTGNIWRIRNDYPAPMPKLAATGASSRDPNKLPTLPGPSVPPIGDPTQDAPWLQIDFATNPLMYSAIIKEYCWEGNINNAFIVQNNTVRNWYHAPWMHWSTNGREPLNGLTFERPTPPLEFASTQKRYLQTWAIGFYNSPGASTFGEMWANPDDPKWTDNYKFPLGTCVFKVLLTDATDAEVPTMSGSPGLPAVIAPTASDPTKKPANPATRNNYATNLRLIQVDWAVRDDRAPIGWVFGTFMYDGNRTDPNPWDRIIPVGVQWGNDPTMNQAAHDAGIKPTESWINPEAERLRIALGGKRPSWGWNGRLDGPADNFISSCASCHSTAQRTGPSGLTPPAPKFVNGKWVPTNDAVTMKWFRNIPSGQPFDPNGNSADYSLQLMIGYHNFRDWQVKNSGAVSRLWHNIKFIPGKAFGYIPEGSPEKREGLRNGPDMHYEDK